MSATRNGLCTSLVLILLLLCELSHSEAREEGDACTVKENLPGICRASSQCEPHIDKYIKTGRLTVNDVPSCGLGTHEEIVCCPVAECCPDDERPSQETTSSSTSTTTTPRSTTIGSTTEKSLDSRATKSQLDDLSPYFDFQQLLNSKTPKAQPQLEHQTLSEFQVQPQNEPRVQNLPEIEPQTQSRGREQQQIQSQAQLPPQIQPHSRPQSQRLPQAQLWPEVQPQPRGRGQQQIPFQSQLPIQLQPHSQPQSQRQPQAQFQVEFQPQFPTQLQPHSQPQSQRQPQPQFQQQSQFQRQQQTQFQPQLQSQLQPQFQQQFQTKPSSPLKSKPSVPMVTHEAMREQPRSKSSQQMEQFQTVGPWGQASLVERQPKIINRPQSFKPSQRPNTATGSGHGQDSMDLIHLVNDRLRQQGMNIVPANQVNTFAQPKETRTTTTTTTTTTARPIAAVDLDPWAPFRFQAKQPIGEELITNELGNGEAVFFGPETTTTPRTIQPTPTTRVDVTSDKERPAVRACRNIEERENLEGLTTHILDGIPVEDGTYPHMAAIAFSNFGSFAYRCGGSLISKRHVLTAAHCVNSPTDVPVHVRLGTVNIESVNKHHQDIAITDNIIIHPEYVSSSKYNDIAILELAVEANLSYYVYPACLDTNLADPPSNSKVFVAGWGVMNQINRSTSKILLRAPLEIVPLEQCNISFAEQTNSKRFLKEGVIDSLLCAGDNRQKKDACQGDSGGPLVLERDIVNNKYSLLGVISSGFGCATKTPGLYTRIASYLSFIEGVVWPNNIV